MINAATATQMVRQFYPPTARRVERAGVVAKVDNLGVAAAICRDRAEAADRLAVKLGWGSGAITTVAAIAVSLGDFGLALQLALVGLAALLVCWWQCIVVAQERARADRLAARWQKRLRTEEQIDLCAA